MVTDDDGDTGKSSVLKSACYMMDEEVPADVQYLRDIVDTMTEKQKLVYKLHVLEGYSFTEIAKLMGTSIPNVKKHYDKAILFIKNNFLKIFPCLWWKKVIILTGLVYRLNLRNKRTKQANKTSEPNKHKKTEENYQLIRKYLKENGLSKTTDIAQAIGLSPARTRAILKEMSGLEYEGTTNNRRYRLADDN